MALRLHHIPVFVRDQERSLAFYRDLLGFAVAVDYSQGAKRFVLVQPPGGNVSLALVRPEYQARIGTSDGIVFVTVDVHAQFEIWSKLGVRFQHAPRLEQWGGAIAPFYDPDGNRYILAAWDDFTRAADAERVRLEEQHQAEQRAATERQLARDVQSRLFRKPYRKSVRWSWRAVAFKRGM